MDSPASNEIIRVSAPGKVILHGEHSVVYGKRAVALSVDLRTHLTLTPGNDTVVVDLPDIEVNESWSVAALSSFAIKLGRKQEAQPSTLSEDQASELLKFLNIPEDANSPKKLALLSFMHLYLSILPRPVGLKISVTSQLPTGAGLGSSAAYAVCVSAALLRLANTINQSFSVYETNESAKSNFGIDIKDVSAWAFQSEQIVHGTPSGIDNSICSYGGAVNFKGGICSSLKIPPLQVLLVNTGVPRSTKALVAGVRERKDRLPNVVESILDALDAVADQGLEILQQLSSSNKDNDSAFKVQHELIDINHALLCALGVSHPSLDRLVGIAASHGLHAKLTGAGGGGFGVVVVGGAAEEQDAVAACHKELEGSGYQVWTTCLGAPGLTFH